MSDNSKVGAIVLAAGSSRRMGRNKALLPVAGQPMLARVIDPFRGARVSPIVVVTGHDPDALKSAITNVQFVHNPNHLAGGMLSSIKTGAGSSVRACDAFFLALADQPFIARSTLQILLDTWRRTHADVLRPIHRGQHGHPILIATRCIDSILALRDHDQTLNDFVRAKSTNVVDVPVEDSATIQDIDTPADYDAAIKRRASDPSAE